MSAFDEEPSNSNASKLFVCAGQSIIVKCGARHILSIDSWFEFRLFMPRNTCDLIEIARSYVRYISRHYMGAAYGVVGKSIKLECYVNLHN